MLHIANGSELLDGLGNQLDVWNSHGDEVTAVPKAASPGPLKVATSPQ
jgi:GMP synthase-like glutamine amidotransferase